MSHKLRRFHKTIGHLLSLRLLFITAAFSFLLFSCLANTDKTQILYDSWWHAFWAADIIHTITADADIPATRVPLDIRYPNEFYFFSWPGKKEAFFPVMTCFFTGAPIIYLMIPFIWFLGITPTAIILPFAVVSLLSCLFIWRVCARMIDSRFALAVLFFLCTDYFFILLTREGPNSHSGLQVMLLWAALWILLCLKNPRYIIRLALGAFILGFALYAKLMFVACILGAIAVVFAARRHDRHKVFVSAFPDGIHLCVFVFAFFMGCLPLVIYNIDTGFATLNQTISCFAGNAFSGLDARMLMLRLNMSERLYQLCWILDGDVVSLLLVRTTPFLIRGGLLLFGFGHSILTARKDKLSYYLLLLYVFYVVAFLSSLLSPSTYSHNHLGILFPFFCLIRGRFFVLALKEWRTYTGVALFVVLLIDAWYAINAILTEAGFGL